MELNEELRLEIESLQNPIMESILLPVPSDLLEEITYSEFVEADSFEILAESSILEENLKSKELEKLQESEE